ncbi:MAG: lamin tail domain-containing protein, partial [Chloroflexus sp.]
MRWITAAIVIIVVGVGLQPSQAQTRLVLINEVMTNPESGSEWVELYNPGWLPVNLSGWRIDDSVIGGPHTVIAEGVVLLPGHLLVVPLTSVILNNNDPDQVQLSDADGQLIDQSPLAVVPRAHTLARQPDGGATWQVDLLSPGWWNSGAPPTILALPPPATTTTTDEIETVEPAPSEAITTAEPTLSPVPDETELAATPTVTAVATFEQVVINEIAAAGESEWVELYNRGEVAVMLAGWTLERVSNSGTTVRRELPVTEIGPGERLVVGFTKGVLPDDGARLT